MISDAKLRTALDLEQGTPPDPVLLADIATRARVFVERQTHRYFGPPVSQVEVATGNGTRHLRLSGKVVSGATSVTEQAYPGATATELVETTGFVVRHHGTISYLVRAGGGVWTDGTEYLVEYTHGYDLDEGPEDIEALIIALVGLRVNAMGNEGKASETIGGYAYTSPAIHAFEDGDLRAIPGAVRTIEYWTPPVFA